MLGQTGEWLFGYPHPTNGVTYVHPTLGLVNWPLQFEAVNLAVIPNTSPTSNSNDVVIAWDLTGQTLPLNVVWPQRFVVGDPRTGVFNNRVVYIPAGYGDLFCSGHCWLPDGRLFVAGGNTQYNTGGSTFFIGSKFAGFWNPRNANVAPNYGWDFSLLQSSPTQPLRELREKRWYPTVTLISDTKVMVSGGSVDTAPTTDYCVNPASDLAFNTYEIFDLTINDWERDPNSTPVANLPFRYNGPLHAGTVCGALGAVLGEYPRLHALSNKRVFLSGEWNGATDVLHVPLAATQAWSVLPNSGAFRGSGSSLVVPNVGNAPGAHDEIMIIGGGVSTPSVSNDSKRINPVTNPVWGNQQFMAYPRMCANAVLGPNGDVVLIGGCSDFYFSTPAANHIPVLITEVWDKLNGWKTDRTQASPRMYHSTAALLPNGMMVSAGGDIRAVHPSGPQFTYDWEIYEPRNMANGQAIPSFAGTWAAAGHMVINFGVEYVIGHTPLPVGVAIQRVVLMMPCSTTHNSDMHQRYIELQLLWDDEGQGPNHIVAKAPAPSVTTVRALRGFYMAFLVTTQGAPSQAKWVWLQ